jgi:hypothetical protein
MIKFKQYFYEKTVVGLIETIFINGIGEVEAKIDSGNGAYNVLHGINIETNGEMVSFTTINNKKIEKPIAEHVTINVGAGNFEDRPVVLFDLKIGEQNFDNVKFSIGNRSNNEYGVLIGKDFIRNDLDALIDVDGRNMFAKHIEVDYE